MTGTAAVGKTVALKISGANFIGTPTVTSSNAGTKVVLVNATASQLTVRVTSSAKAHVGTATFTITEINGDTCKVKYTTK